MLLWNFTANTKKQTHIFPRIIFNCSILTSSLFPLSLMQECVPDGLHLAVLKKTDNKIEEDPKLYSYENINYENV